MTGDDDDDDRPDQTRTNTKRMDHAIYDDLAAEVLARGRAASPGRRSSNANSLCGQNSAGSGQSERPFKGIFCDDVSEFESDHLSQPVSL